MAKNQNKNSHINNRKQSTLMGGMTAFVLLFVLFFLVPFWYLFTPLLYLSSVPYIKYGIPVVFFIIYLISPASSYIKNGQLNFVLITLYSLFSAICLFLLSLVVCDISMLIPCDVDSLLTVKSILAICYFQIILWTGTLLIRLTIHKSRVIDKGLIISVLIASIAVSLVKPVLQLMTWQVKNVEQKREQTNAQRELESEREREQKRVQHREEVQVSFPTIDQFQIVPYQCSESSGTSTFITDDQRIRLRFDEQYKLRENDNHTHNFHLKEKEDTVLSVSHKPDVFRFQSDTVALEALLSHVKLLFMDTLRYKTENMNPVIYKMTSHSGIVSYYLSFKSSSEMHYDREMLALVKLDANEYQMWDAFTYKEIGNTMFREILCSLETNDPSIN